MLFLLHVESGQNSCTIARSSFDIPIGSPRFALFSFKMRHKQLRSRKPRREGLKFREILFSKRRFCTGQSSLELLNNFLCKLSHCFGLAIDALDDVKELLLRWSIDDSRIGFIELVSLVMVCLSLPKVDNR